MLYINLYVILSYTCYVVTKEMLYMWQRICPVLDKCYIRGHKWHLFGCRSICRVEGDNFDNFHPFVFDNHHHLCLWQSSSSFVFDKHHHRLSLTIIVIFIFDNHYHRSIPSNEKGYYSCLMVQIQLCIWKCWRE